MRVDDALAGFRAEAALVAALRGKGVDRRAGEQIADFAQALEFFLNACEHGFAGFIHRRLLGSLGKNVGDRRPDVPESKKVYSVTAVTEMAWDCVDP